MLEQEFEQGKSLAQACYLPTPADVYVSAFRKWCGHPPGTIPAPPPTACLQPAAAAAGRKRC